MKYTAKTRHLWKRKADNKVVGRVVEIKNGDSIDNYEEIEFPESLKKMFERMREMRTTRNVERRNNE